MQSHLVKYEAACHALAEARSVDEVKSILIAAEAMKAAARLAKNKDLEADAFELRKRGERHLGQLMQAQAKTVGLARPGNPNWVARGPDSPPTLAEAGIDKHLADRSRKLAAFSDGEFIRLVTQGRQQITEQADRIQNRVINEQTLAKIRAKPSRIPLGKYSCIVVDPPWPMEKIERDVRPNQVGFDYPTMSEDELIEFDISSMAADDCHLFCWATQKFLPIAMDLVEAWGFTYVLTMVWHKPGGFQPIDLPQYNCEFVVYARRGTPRFIDTKAFNCCFIAPRREHSRKPEEFYETIRRVTVAPRIDVFSREPHEGFSQYGNEADKFK